MSFGGVGSILLIALGGFGKGNSGCYRFGSYVWMACRVLGTSGIGMQVPYSDTCLKGQRHIGPTPGCSYVPKPAKAQASNYTTPFCFLLLGYKALQAWRFPSNHDEQFVR